MLYEVIESSIYIYIYIRCICIQNAFSNVFFFSSFILNDCAHWTQCMRHPMLICIRVFVLTIFLVPGIPIIYVLLIDRAFDVFEIYPQIMQHNCIDFYHSDKYNGELNKTTRRETKKNYLWKRDEEHIGNLMYPNV